jgi:hypothetical protein
VGKRNRSGKEDEAGVGSFLPTHSLGDRVKISGDCKVHSRSVTPGILLLLFLSGSFIVQPEIDGLDMIGGRMNGLIAGGQGRGPGVNLLLEQNVPALTSTLQSAHLLRELLKYYIIISVDIEVRTQIADLFFKFIPSDVKAKDICIHKQAYR